MQILYPGTNNANYSRIASADLPTWIKTDGSNSFTVAAWVRRASTASTSFRAVCILGNLFHIQISSGTGAAVRLVVHDDDGSTNCSAVLEPANSEWIFLACSFNASTNAMVMVARSQSKSRTAATATYVPGGVTTRTYGDFFVGKNKLTTEGGGAGTAAAWDGDIGWIAVHNVASTQGTLETLVDAAFTELSGQTGRYSPIIPLTGPGFLGHKWFVPHGIASQQPLTNADTTDYAGVGGDRVGATVADGTYVWWNFTAGTSSNADAEAIMDVYSPFDVNGTLVHIADDAAFFGLVPPGLTTNGNNGVASTTLVELRDNTPRVGAGIRRIGCSANSRGCRTEAFTGGPATYGAWSANFAHGLAASRYSNVGGMVNVPVLGGANSRPIFDMPIGPASSGTISAITSSTYNDFSRLWTNSPVTGSKGPGHGVRLAPSASLCQRVRIASGTKINGATAIMHDAFVLEFPGSTDTCAWDIRDGATAGDAGTSAASGSETGIDTTSITYTYTTVTDSYSSGTPSITLALSAPDQVTLAALLAATPTRIGLHISAGTGTGSIAQILSITPGATCVITLKHALATAIGNGATIKLGRVGIRRMRNTAPIATNAYQGYTLTAGSGGTGIVWFAVSAVATGVDGWAPGTFGWGAHGFTAQISEAWTGIYALIADALDLDAMFYFVAGQQSSTHADREAFADLIGLPAGDSIFASDPVHRIVDNQTVDFAEDSLAQSARPALVATESAGSLMACASFSGKHNNTHPSMEQYYLLWSANWTIAAGIEAEPSGGGISDPDNLGYFSRNRASGLRRLVFR